MYSIVASPVLSRSFPRSLQLASLDELLPDVEIDAICQDIGHVWRNRQLPPGPTVRSMVYRGLNHQTTPSQPSWPTWLHSRVPISRHQRIPHGVKPATACPKVCCRS